MLFNNYKKSIERVNTLTHGLAALLALPAVIVLLVYASLKGDPLRIISFSVYGVSLVLLYVISTLYHGSNGGKKRLLQRLDHIAIYLLIAGSYTPITLVVLNGAWGWSLFGVVWTLAVVGILLDSLRDKQRRVIQMAIYFIMGWLALIALYPLWQHMPLGGLIWLLIGGVFYTTGIIFYAMEGRIRYGHGIWHLFVMAGSASHYIVIFYYLL